MEPAGLQGLAWSPTKAGTGQAGVVPTLAHSRALGRSGLPATEIQPLVVDVQHTDAAPEADTHGGPLKHPATGWGSGVREQRLLSYSQL